jgi:hypothetical protein
MYLHLYFSFAQKSGQEINVCIFKKANVGSIDLTSKAFTVYAPPQVAVHEKE